MGLLINGQKSGIPKLKKPQYIYLNISFVRNSDRRKYIVLHKLQVGSTLIVMKQVKN